MNPFRLILLILSMSFLQFSCANANERDVTTRKNGNGKIIVIYFSQTEHTKAVADYIANFTGADSWRIQAAIPYTAEDINYGNSSSRTSIEQNDASARPQLKETFSNLADYNIIFLGYPIWWGISPRIILTFLEKHDLSGKTIIPFCTSASSGIGSSDTQLHNFAPNATWETGHRFSIGSSQATVESWVKSINITSGIASTNAASEIKQSSVYTFDGKFISRNNGKTDVRNLPNGKYIITNAMSDGTTSTQKIIR